MQYSVRLIGKHQLSRDTVELRFQRPAGCEVTAGQKIRFFYNRITRDYTLVSGPDQEELAICVRRVNHGRFSPYLTEAAVGTVFQISAPFGYFTYQPTSRPSVLIATGTGIAPFVAFVRSGVSGFHLLQGARFREDLYYRSELEAAAGSYVACLSGETDQSPAEPGDGFFPGHVTTYLEDHLAAGNYDFYLCGRGDMLEKATHIIDRRFPEPIVFTEQFY
jgi:ferredoxin-NADP reductase